MKIRMFPHQARLPLTGAPSLLRLSVNAASVDGLSIGLLKVTSVIELRDTPAAPSDG